MHGLLLQGLSSTAASSYNQRSEEILSCAATIDEHYEDTTQQNSAQHTNKLPEAAYFLMYSKQSEDCKRQGDRGVKVGEVEAGEMKEMGGQHEVR